jgi:trafficking protein particle complex subunit 10
MSLYEEALLAYDELEALFFQVLREKNLSWFGTLFSPTRQDDSAPLLAVDKKPYRDLILANSISVFDFRVYLLARQCALLSCVGRIVEVGQKVVSFLNSFGRRLRDIQVGNSSA